MSTTTKVTACENCGEPVEQPVTGRPRKFCDRKKCKKQAARWAEAAKRELESAEALTKAERAFVAVLNNDILRVRLFEVMNEHWRAIAGAISSFEAIEGMVPAEMKGTTALVVYDGVKEVYRHQSVNRGIATEAVAELVYERLGRGITATMAAKRVKARLVDAQRSSEEFERRWVPDRDDETGAILTDAAGNDIMKRVTVRRSKPADMRDRENDVDDSSDDPIGDDGLNPGERRVVRKAPSSSRGSEFKNPSEQAVANVERQRKLEKLRREDPVAWRVYMVFRASQTDARTFADLGHAIIASSDAVSFGDGADAVLPVSPMTEEDAEASFQPRNPNQDIWAILDYWFNDLSREELEQTLQRAIKAVEG